MQLSRRNLLSRLGLRSISRALVSLKAILLALNRGLKVTQLALLRQNMSASGKPLLLNWYKKLLLMHGQKIGRHLALTSPATQQSHSTLRTCLHGRSSRFLTSRNFGNTLKGVPKITFLHQSLIVRTRFTVLSSRAATR